MTDAAPRAAVSDDEGPISIAPAFHPCADVGIGDEQVDVAVRKPELGYNDLEVPLDRVAQPRQAAVLPSAVNLRRATTDCLEHHQRFGVRVVPTVP